MDYTIYPIAGGRYEVTVNGPRLPGKYFRNGKPKYYRKKISRKTQMAVAKGVEEYLNGSSDGFDEEKVADQTFASYCDLWVGSKVNLKPGTVYKRKWKVAALRERFGRRHISAITYQELQDFFNTELADMTSQSEIKSAAFSVFKLALREGSVLSNPAEFIELSRLPTSQEESIEGRWSLDINQQHDLLDMLGERYPEHQGVVQIMLELGVRPHELRVLQWEDVYLELDRPMVYFHRDPKTIKSKRKIILPPKSLAVLTDHPGRSATGRVFTKHMDKDGLRYRIQTSAKKAGLERPVTTYDLRHTAATRMVSEMHPQKFIELFGWATQRMASHYVKRNQANDPRPLPERPGALADIIRSTIETNKDAKEAKLELLAAVADDDGLREEILEFLQGAA